MNPYALGQRVRVVSEEEWRADIAGLVGVVAEPPAAVRERQPWSGHYREEGGQRVYWIEFDARGVVGAVDGAEVDEEALQPVDGPAGGGR